MDCERGESQLPGTFEAGQRISDAGPFAGKSHVLVRVQSNPGVIYRDRVEESNQFIRQERKLYCFF